MPVPQTNTRPHHVLVTGGAGFLGINLIRFLLQRGVGVTSLDIADFTYRSERERVRVIKGDIRDESAVQLALSGCDAVVHCAAALPLYPPETIYSTDVTGTRIVLESARQAGVARVVHISTTAVYGIPDHHPLVEDDRLDGVGPYGQAKIQAEMIVLEERLSGLAVPILRPKSFVGPERLGVFAMLYEWAFEGRNFPILGMGHNRYQLLDVDDLCTAIWLCLVLPPETVNDTFNIGARDFSTVRSEYQAVLDAAGHGKRVIGFPAAPAIALLRCLETLHLSPIYKWIYETASKDSFVSVDKARRQLGWEPVYSNKDALLRNFEWYRQNQDQFASASGITHRVPWAQGILGLIKHLF
jgi:nucleoside-diphosphate-sugar epimerase